MSKEEFKLLFDNHFDAVRNYVYYRCGDAELATDVAQETFLKVWEKQLEFIPGKGFGLLFKIASDIFISDYRRNTVHNKFKNAISIENEEITPEDEMTYRELSNSYETALANMPDNQRVVFLMSRSEGLKYKEIAERLDLSVKAIEKRMTQALDYIRENLKTYIEYSNS